MPFTYLRNAPQWEAYKTKFIVDNPPDGEVVWGNGPRAYPCSVVSTYATPGQILSCYMYDDDARAHLKASMASNLEDSDNADDLPGLRAELDDLRRRHGELAKMFREYATYANAHLRVFLERALGTFYKSKEWYEGRLAQELAWIDRQNEAKRHSLIMGDLTKAAPQEEPPTQE